MISSSSRQRLGAAVGTALHAVIRVRHVNDAGHARLHRPAPRIAGGRQRRAGAAVVRAVARQNLVAAGGQPREANRVFGRFRAAVGEEEDVDVTGRDLRELLPEPRARLGGHEWIRVGQRRRLILNRLDHARIAVADVDAHQLAVEVDEALAFRRPEINALGFRHRNGIDVRLRRPLVQRVLLRQRDHFLTAHGLFCYGHRHHPSVGVVNDVITASARTLVQLTMSSTLQYSSGWCARSQLARPVRDTMRHAGNSRNVFLIVGARARHEAGGAAGHALDRIGQRANQRRVFGRARRLEDQADRRS